MARISRTQVRAPGTYAVKFWPETKSAEAKINQAEELAKKDYDARTEQYKKA